MLPSKIERQQVEIGVRNEFKTVKLYYTVRSYLPMPFIPAEPRLRHCSLKRSIGSLVCLEFSIFLHFCLISVSDLDVAAMLLSIVCNKYGALRKSRRFYFSVTVTTTGWYPVRSLTWNRGLKNKKLLFPGFKGNEIAKNL